MFLPANTTSILQPMDQGVSAQAWEEASSSLLARAWNKLLFQPAQTSLSLAANGDTDGVGSKLLSAVEETSSDDVACTGNFEENVTDFDDLFSDLGYNNTDPNWKTPQEWLNEDA